MSQILGHPRWPTTPLAFCAGRQPARKWKKAERSNLTQRDKPSSRRLQLAAEGSGAIGIALRRWRRQTEAADFGQPTAAMSRWRVSVLPSAPLPVPGIGRARWLVELIRCRAGESADFELEACDDTGRLTLPSHLGYGPGQKEAGR